jgi:hypothetical protein
VFEHLQASAGASALDLGQAAMTSPPGLIGRAARPRHGQR